MTALERLFETSGGKLLTFNLGDQEYGIEILQAREVVRMMRIDAVPQAPYYMEGFINLRGKIIPVIDLRKKFQLSEVKRNSETSIVVVDIHGKQTGVIVDQLSGVVTIEKSTFEESPDFGSGIDTEYISGMAKLDNRVIVVLDMEKILDNVRV